MSGYKHSSYWLVFNNYQFYQVTKWLLPDRKYRPTNSDDGKGLLKLGIEGVVPLVYVMADNYKM